MFCTQCGTKLKGDQKFCTNCGTSVGSVTPLVAASRTAVATPPMAAGRPPTSRSSSALAAEIPVPIPTPEIPRPIPVASVKPPKSEVGQRQSDQTSASPKSPRPLLIWGVLGVVALVAAVTLLLYLRSAYETTVPDAEIEKSIQAKFAADPDLSKYAIAIRSQKGVVTLMGFVNKTSDRSTAARIVLQQHGVKTLVDDLVLTTTVEKSTVTQDQVATDFNGPTQAGSLKTVTVIGNRPWTDTGVDLNEGEAVSVNASGNISFSRRGQAIGPQGDQPSCAVYRNPRVPFVARDLRCHSLIGRIGSAGAFFQLGSSTQFRAPVAGRLYLGVNDNFFPDNSGSWTAVISEQSPSPGTAIVQQSSNPGTLRLFAPQIDPPARRVVLNGVDTARPSTPFHFDWGDGSESVGFFPQTKMYDQAGRTYTIKVVATYPDGTHGSAETIAKIP